MKRFEITITADAPDDLFEQGTVLSAAKPELHKLIDALRNATGGEVSHETKVLPQRKARTAAPDPTTQIAQGRPADDVVVEHTPQLDSTTDGAGTDPLYGARQHTKGHARPVAAE